MYNNIGAQSKPQVNKKARPWLTVKNGELVSAGKHKEKWSR